jgi:uridine phosphorylase
LKANAYRSHEIIPASELILRNDGTLYHLGIGAEDVGDHIIIVGDPERVEMVSSYFDRIHRKIASREFVVHTGEFKGRTFTVVSTGIGIDNVDIVLQEIDAAANINLSERTVNPSLRSLEIVRIGTCGALRADIEPGTFIASSHAIAIDGVPYSYDISFEEDELDLLAAVRQAFPTLAHHSGLYAVHGNQDLMARIGFDMVKGITYTANGFYGPQGRTLRVASTVEPMIVAMQDFRWNKLPFTNFEMECAGIYAAGAMLGHKALTVCTALANRVKKEFHNHPSASIKALVEQVLERY